MRHILIASLGIALLASPSHAEKKSQTMWDQAWDVSSHPDVHVVVDDGHVRIHAGPSGKVKAHVEFNYKRWGLVFGMTSPVVMFEHKNDQIWITARDPKGVGVIGAYEEKLVVDVTVPAELTLSVRSGDGAVDCDPLGGRFTFETGDGAVRAHGLKGDVEVSTGDGRVILDDIDGRLRARTRDGHLTASGRFDALDLGTGDGRVDASARPGSRLASTWSVETGDGAVSLRIPHDLAALLDTRTRDGSINVELPISVQGRVHSHELIGELNGGGPTLRVRTGDGSITLGLSE